MFTTVFVYVALGVFLVLGILMMRHALPLLVVAIKQKQRNHILVAICYVLLALAMIAGSLFPFGIVFYNILKELY